MTKLQPNAHLRRQLWSGVYGVQPNKHVRLACHYARELTEQEVIAPQRVASAENLADMFTKPLPGPAFKLMLPSFVSEAPEVAESV